MSPEQCNQDNGLVKVASNTFEQNLKEIKIAEEKYMEKQYKFKQFMYWQDTVQRKKITFLKLRISGSFLKSINTPNALLSVFMCHRMLHSSAFFSLAIFQQMAPEHQKSVHRHLVSVSPLYSCCELPVELTRYIKHVSTEIREALIFKALLF